LVHFRPSSSLKLTGVLTFFLSCLPIQALCSAFLGHSYLNLAIVDFNLLFSAPDTPHRSPESHIAVIVTLLSNGLPIQTPAAAVELRGLLWAAGFLRVETHTLTASL
jgi:hypothetical protein